MLSTYLNNLRNIRTNLKLVFLATIYIVEFWKGSLNSSLYLFFHSGTTYQDLEKFMNKVYLLKVVDYLTIN